MVNVYIVREWFFNWLQLCMSVSLRDYQTDGVNRLRSALVRHRRVLFQLPTGGGKTAVASFMSSVSRSRGKRVWFICHRKELVLQTSLTFQKFGIAHGFIAAGRKFDPRQLVHICSIDTLKGRMHLLEAPDLIIWDECHHLGAAGWAAVMAAYPKARHVGLSATPIRADGQGLDAFFDDMVLGPTVAWLIEQGHLSPFTVYAPPAPPELKARGAGDGTGAQAKIMNTPKLTGDVISHWVKRAYGLRTIAFACDVRHSMDMAARFNASGIPAAHLDGDSKDRDEKIRAYADGRIMVISNVSLFGEGFDLSAIAQRDVPIRCVIQNRKTDSLALHLQQVGRALRPSPDGEAIILDHAGNRRQHGDADDEREWTLEGRDKAAGPRTHDGPPPPIECPKCFAGVKRPLPLFCKCGAAIPQPAAREIEVAEGELEEVTDVTRRQERASKAAAERLACAEGLGALVILACRRGYPNPQQWALKKLSDYNASKRHRIPDQSAGCLLA